MIEMTDAASRPIGHFAVSAISLAARRPGEANGRIGTVGAGRIIRGRIGARKPRPCALSRGQLRLVRGVRVRQLRIEPPAQSRNRRRGKQVANRQLDAKKLAQLVDRTHREQ